MTDWVCGRSGACCRAADAVGMTVGEWAAIRAVADRPVAVRAMPDGRVEVSRIEGRGCPYYEGGCVVYDVRPGVCRAFGCFRRPGEAYTDDVMVRRVGASAGVRRVARRMLEEAERWTNERA